MIGVTCKANIDNGKIINLPFCIKVIKYIDITFYVQIRKFAEVAGGKNKQ